MTKPKDTNILEMPVELISKIFLMMNFRDKVNLSMVCKRFNSILHRAELNRYIDMRDSYDVRAKNVMRYLDNEEKMKHVLHLDLTSCYWLPPSFLSMYLPKLENLRTLRAVDNHLTAIDIATIFIAAPELTDISFTWCVDLQRKDPLPNLKALYIYRPVRTNDSVENIVKFLLLCENLEKLSIVRCELFRNESAETSFTPIRDAVMKVLPKLILPNLCYLVITSPKLEYDEIGKLFAEKILEIMPKNPCVWEKLWCPRVVRDHDAVFDPKVPLAKAVFITDYFPTGHLPLVERARISSDYYLRRRAVAMETVHGLTRHARYLSVPADGIDYNLAHLLNPENRLEELNIYALTNIPWRFWDCSKFLMDGKRLKKLGLPGVVLTAIPPPPPPPSSSGETSATTSKGSKRPKVATKTDVSRGSILDNIITCCPNIEEFEIGLENCIWGDDENRETVNVVFETGSAMFLSSVAKWTKLTNLTICGVTAVSLMFLEEIGRGCPNIESLSLMYLELSYSTFSMHELAESLPLFTKLQDFVLLQPDSSSSEIVLNSLRQKSLRRVVLRCDPFPPTDIEDLLMSCQKVIFFIFLSSCTSRTTSELIQNALMARHRHRQGLVIRIAYMKQDDPTWYTDATLRDVPAIHENEMLYEGYRIVHFPHSEKRFFYYE